MNEIAIGTKKYYDAIEVYEKLTEHKDKKTPFNDWITRHIKNWGFVEGKDFYAKKSKSLITLKRGYLESNSR